MEKLKDAKKIKWVEEYTEKTDFLKSQFNSVVGKGSYRRWVGKEIGGPGEWYVVVSPADVHEHKRAKFFAGIRKMPDSYPAGGKYFDTIKEAYEYAFETWGTPKPEHMPNFTSGDLKGISKKIDKWKKKKEQIESEASIPFDIFRIKTAMAKAATFKDDLSFDLSFLVPLLEGLDFDDVNTGEILYQRILKAANTTEEEIKKDLEIDAKTGAPYAYTVTPSGQKVNWNYENTALAKNRTSINEKTINDGSPEFFKLVAKICTIGRMKRKKLLDEFVAQVGTFDKQVTSSLSQRFYMSNFEEAIFSTYNQYQKNIKRIRKNYDFSYYAYDCYVNPRDPVLERKVERGEVSEEQATIERAIFKVKEQLRKKFDFGKISAGEKENIERQLAALKNLSSGAKSADYKSILDKVNSLFDPNFKSDMSYEEFKRKLESPAFAEKYGIKDSEIPLRCLVNYGRRDSACGYWLAGPYFSERSFNARYYVGESEFKSDEEFGYTGLEYVILAANGILKTEKGLAFVVKRGGKYEYVPVDKNRTDSIIAPLKNELAEIESYMKTGKVSGSGMKSSPIYKSELDGKSFKKVIEYIDLNILKNLDYEYRNRITTALKKFMKGWAMAVKGQEDVNKDFNATVESLYYGALYAGRKSVPDRISTGNITEIITTQSSHLYKYSVPASSIAAVMAQFRGFGELSDSDQNLVQSLIEKLVGIGEKEIKMADFINLVQEAGLSQLLNKYDIIYIYNDAIRSGASVPVMKDDKYLHTILQKTMNNVVKKIESKEPSTLSDWEKAYVQYYRRGGYKIRNFKKEDGIDNISRVTLTRILRNQSEIVDGKKVRIFSDDFIDNFIDNMKKSSVVPLNYRSVLEIGDIRPVAVYNPDGFVTGVLGYSDYAYYKMMMRKFRDLWGLAETNPKLYEDVLRCFFIPEELRSTVESIGVPTFIDNNTKEAVTVDESGNALVFYKGRVAVSLPDGSLKPTKNGRYTAVVSSSPLDNIEAIEKLIEDYFSDEENKNAYKLSSTFTSKYYPKNNTHPKLVASRTEMNFVDSFKRLSGLEHIQDNVLDAVAEDIGKAFAENNPEIEKMVPGIKPREEMDEKQRALVDELISAVNPSAVCMDFIQAIEKDFEKNQKKNKFLFTEFANVKTSNDQAYEVFKQKLFSKGAKRQFLNDFIKDVFDSGLEISEAEIEKVFNKVEGGKLKGQMAKKFDSVMRTLSENYGVRFPYRIDSFSRPYSSQLSMSPIVSKITTNLGYSAFVKDENVEGEENESSYLPLGGVANNPANAALIMNSSFEEFCYMISLAEGAPQEIALDEGYVAKNPKLSGINSKALAIAIRLGTNEDVNSISEVSSVFNYASAFKSSLYRMIREAAKRRMGTAVLPLDMYVSFLPKGEDKMVWYDAVNNEDWGDRAVIMLAQQLISWIHKGTPGANATLNAQQLSELFGVSASSENVEDFSEIEDLFAKSKDVVEVLESVNENVDEGKIEQRLEEEQVNEKAEDEAKASKKEGPSSEESNAVDTTPIQESPAEAEETNVIPETATETSVQTEVVDQGIVEEPVSEQPKIDETPSVPVNRIPRKKKALPVTDVLEPLEEKTTPVQEPSAPAVENPPAAEPYVVQPSRPRPKRRASLLSLIRVAKIFNNRGEYLKADAINNFVKTSLNCLSEEKGKRVAVVKTLSNLLAVSKDFEKRGKLEEAEEINRTVKKYLDKINQVDGDKI